MYMQQLPASINKYIFRFWSHPVADAIRNKITEFQTFFGQYGSSDLNTFYIFFFLERKIMALPKIHDDMYERLGDSAGIDSDYFRPSLRRLYESHFGVLFRSTTLSTLIGQPFGQIK
ncbi:MAG: hypothetical protein ACKPKO_46350 [Candidatus Fonsibacter sp.]